VARTRGGPCRYGPTPRVRRDSAELLAEGGVPITSHLMVVNAARLKDAG
jgi:hypothetical protein